MCVPPDSQIEPHIQNIVMADGLKSGNTEALCSKDGANFDAVFIGCAGWGNVSAAPRFASVEGRQLERYATAFTAVEINSFFYRAHRHSTYVRWADCVPPTFRFSVKLPRTITHSVRLACTDGLLTQFREETQGLGAKLGCVLVQLPPSLQFDPTVANSFFELMRAEFECMIACEACHVSWFSDAASMVLQKYVITRVIADPAKGLVGPHQPTTPSSYMRLHGSPKIYYSSYSDTCLAQVAQELVMQARQHHPAWVIFDNTASGAALPNALYALDAVSYLCDGKRFG